ncbi:hypothetical protein ANO14919_062530 [Xylariales sp. No.14919]|nr:hypothetical protein ANO14919_062530 [Xylariales sp. No.14919]
MGRSRKKTRHSRFNLKSSDNHDQRHNRDRDDDFMMHGVEHNKPALPKQSRRRGYSNDNNNSNNGRSGRGRAVKKRNVFDPFDDTLFENLNLSESVYQDQQGPKFQQRPRNQNRKRNRSQHGRDDYPQHQGGSHSPPRANSQGANNDAQIQRRAHGKNIFLPSPPSTPPSSQSSSLAGLGRPRFCLECSAVRRANLILRDLFSAALTRASGALDSWGDEVGVSRGSGDEMDWQPEPVVRVLILAANPTTGLPCDAGAEWQQQPSYNAGYGGGAAETSRLTTSPGANRGGGLFPSGNSNVFLSGMINDAFGPQSARMMTPPDTPPFLIA